jgi:dimethylglycine dehydrogenase
MNLEILAPDEIKDKYPFIETHDLKGALYDPNADGDIDPAQLTQALAKGARDLGATILRFCPATGVAAKTASGSSTEKGDIRCEIVVNAAGYYAQRVGEWFKPFGGRTVPMMVMSHQYMLFDEVPEVAATGRRRWVTSCRCCATWTCPTTSGRRRTASTSAPTSATARRIGPTRPIRCPRISAFSFIPTRSTGCRMVDRGFHGPRARAGRGGAGQDDQRPDPLCARRQPADRADAGRAQRLRGLRLHLRHRAGRRRGQGAGRMDHRGRDRMGHVVLRPAPLHRLHRSRLLRRQGDGGLRPRIRHAFPWHRWPAAPDRKVSPVHDR